MPKFLGGGPYDVLNMLEYLGNKIWLVDGCAFEKKLRFCAYRSKNQNKSRRCRNSTKLGRSSICIFFEVFAKNNSKFDFKVDVLVS